MPGGGWGFFGGRIEPEETKQEALIREIQEKLEYPLTNYTYLGEYKNVIEERLVIRELFIAPLNTSLNELTLREGAGMNLFSIKEAKQLPLITGDEQGIQLIEEYFSNQTNSPDPAASQDPYQRPPQRDDESNQ